MVVGTDGTRFLCTFCVGTETHSHLISAASADSRSRWLYKQRSHDGHEASLLPDTELVMSSPSTTPSKRHIDSHELIRFAKNTSNLIRNVLEKVHRLPHQKQKKLKRCKKTTNKSDSQQETHDRRWIDTPSDMYSAETIDPCARWSDNTDRPVHSSTFDLPLGYFMSNMYEEEELSVENLLPSLIPDDFPVNGSTHAVTAVHYASQSADMQSY